MSQIEFIKNQLKQNKTREEIQDAFFIRYSGSSSSSFRGRYSQARCQLEHQVSNVTTVEVSDSTDSLDIEKLRAENRVLKERNAQLISNRLLEDKVVDMFQASMKEPKPLLKISKALKFPKTERTGFLHLSDIHYSMIIKKEEVHGINEYNEGIAEKRLDYVVNYAMNEMKLLGGENIVIFLGGDLISGSIHEELNETNESIVTDSVIKLAHILYHHIRKIDREYDTHIVAIPGNHGRLHKKPRYKNASKLSWEYILYKILALLLSQDTDVEMTIPEAKSHIIKINGFGLYLNHGEDIGGGSGGFAVAPNTASRDYSKIAAIVDRNKESNLTYFLQGHLHFASIIPIYSNRYIIYNGSLCGPDEYAVNRVKMANDASQNFFFIQKGKGLQYHTPINCQHII